MTRLLVQTPGAIRARRHRSRQAREVVPAVVELPDPAKLAYWLALQGAPCKSDDLSDVTEVLSEYLNEQCKFADY